MSQKYINSLHKRISHNIAFVAQVARIFNMRNLTAFIDHVYDGPLSILVDDKSKISATFPDLFVLKDQLAL